MARPVTIPPPLLLCEVLREGLHGLHKESLHGRVRFNEHVVKTNIY